MLRATILNPSGESTKKNNYPAWYHKTNAFDLQLPASSHFMYKCALKTIEERLIIND